MKKYLLTFAMALLVLTGCNSEANTQEDADTADVAESESTEEETTEEATTEEATKEEATEEETTEDKVATNSDNILTPVEEYYISDDDFDNKLGSEEDTVYTLEEGIEKTGLVTTATVTDEGGDGVVNLDEPIHIKIELENTSDSNYDISQLHVDGGVMFEEGNWHDMVVDGGYEGSYTLDDKFSRLEADGMANFDFAPGDTFTFEVDGSIGAGEEDKFIDRYDNEKETDYLNFDYIATNNDDGTVYYYELGKETFSIDLTK